MERNRLEAFSDSVLAIIITIMILELKQPVGAALSDLLAYLLSFMFVATKPSLILFMNHSE